uniref:WD40 repeat domain-containing protein n=1 Tax=Streptomyces sp. SM14 TaxID=1736045 RepID=UPI0015E19902
PGGMDADSQFAATATRACWTGEGPHAFVGADFGSVLFDGEGRTLWADPAGAVACFTPDGRALVVVQEEVSVWFLAGLARPGAPADPVSAHAPGEVLLTRLPLPDAPPERPCSYWPVRLAAVSDDARGLVFSTQLDRGAARRRQVICRWPEDGGPPEARLLPPGPGPAAALSALAVDPAGATVARAVLSDDARLLLDELGTGAPRWRYALPPGGRRGPQRLHTAFSADGRRVVLAAADGRSVVLDAATGVPVGAFREPGPTLQAVALDATGDLVAHGMVGDGRGRVVVRRVADGTALLEAGPRELRQLIGLAFAPDGGSLAAAGATHGRDAALWTVPLSGTDPAPLPRTAAHDLPMSDQPRGALVWTAAGARAVFPGSRGASVVWDATSGRVLADVPFGAGEGAIALSPDGRTLVTVTQAGARRWPL